MIGKNRILVAGGLLAAALVPIAGVAWSYRSIVRRTALPVDDLPGYGPELRALDPYHSPPERNPPARTPDGSYRVVTTSWGGFAGRSLLGLVVDRAFYHTVCVWDEKAGTLTPVVSIKEADPHSGIAHRYAWSSDSQALLIHGAGRLPENYDQAVDLCLVYLPRSDTLYRLANCPPPLRRGLGP